MDFVVTPPRDPVRAFRTVPGSKSLHQRALVLRALAGGETLIDTSDLQPPGDDVRRLGAALDAFGVWNGAALGTSRASTRVDLHLNGTGMRFAVAAAALRPQGARTLVTGRPSLLRRPHSPLLRALRTLGVRLKRRHSGAVRVIGGPPTAGRVRLDGSLSSQFASALMLIAPRTGGLEIELAGTVVSRPYLALTADVLRAFGIEARVEPERIRVEGGAPSADRYRVEADASAAAVWWCVAALTGGEITVGATRRDGRQADLAVLPILERMGAEVFDAERGVGVRARGPLRAAGEIDLRDSPDLLPLCAVLAAVAEGRTRIVGVAHARGKESDRVAVVAERLAGLGVAVDVAQDGLTVEGGEVRGGRVDVAGDHRIAFAFGALGQRLPGIVLAGAQAVEKSHPAFLTDLQALAEPRS